MSTVEYAAVQETVEQIGREILEADPDETGSLGRVRASLERLAGELEEERLASASLVAALITGVEAAMQADGAVVRQGLGLVVRGVAMLQRMQHGWGESGADEVDDLELLAELMALGAGQARQEGTEMAPEMLIARGGGTETAAEGYGSGDEVEELTPEMLIARGGGTETAAEGYGSGDEVEELIEEISQQVMMADLDDLSRIGAIDAGLEALADRLPEERPRGVALCRALAALAEKIILEEVGADDDPLDLMAQGVSLLQQLQFGFARSGKEGVERCDLLDEIARVAGYEAPGAAASGNGSAFRAVDGQEEGVAGGAERPAAALEGEIAAAGAGSSPQKDQRQGSAPAPRPMAIDLSAVDADIFADFHSEAQEHLETAESTLLSLESNPEDKELLNTVFRAFHTIKGAAGFLNLQEVTRVAHAVEDILDAARKDKLTLNSAILDVVLESVDLLKGLLGDVGNLLRGGIAEARDVAGFLARVRGASQGPLETTATVQPAGADSREAAPPAPPEAAAREALRAIPGHPEEAAKEEGVAQEKKGPTAADSAPSRQHEQHFVRVGTEKLDQLVNMVGELVISQTQVTQNPLVHSAGDQKLGRDISQLSKISKDIQEIAMSLRMVPIRSTFERMARTVRDLARKCGKEVEMQMAGEDTELDKNVVEELVDPLTHMVRNAVDHGVETPEERRAAGKPEKGVVRLEAYHKGGNIVIEMRDDGQGLNREKILKKAVERGLVQPNQELTDREIFALIFHPGLSTAEKVSDVSGRGVGMDVVRRSIEQLRGKVEVHSEPGRGSAFLIRLPLTLAIIDGMVIGVGDQRYILPLTSIVRSLRPTPEEVSTVLGQGEVVRIQNELFPLVRLYRRFAITPRTENPSESLVVLVDAEGRRYCLLVDELLGMQQVVIKALAEQLRDDPSLSGCAILGDGRVGLILEPNGLAPVVRANGKIAPRTSITA